MQTGLLVWNDSKIGGCEGEIKDQCTSRLHKVADRSLIQELLEQVFFLLHKKLHQQHVGKSDKEQKTPKSGVGGAAISRPVWV